MRILIYGLNFWPELIGIGKYTGELADWLAKQGEDIRVVTAPPYYPKWRVGNGYSGWRYKREKLSHITVWRCPIWVPKKVTGVKRIIHLMSFAVSSIPIMLYNILWKPDVVFVVEPTFFCAPAGWFTAKTSGAKSWLHIQDFETDAALKLELLPQGVIFNLVKAFESFMMLGFHRVSTISEKMLEILKEKKVPDIRTLVFPNWVNTNDIHPLGLRDGLRRELGIGENTVIVLYSGNMGKKQGLEIVIEAARILTEATDILFILCGAGVERNKLMRIAQGMRNVRLLPLQPYESLNELLNLGDIHILPQRADAEDVVMPSKLTGILACGGSLIATARPYTELCEVVTQAGGIAIEPGNGIELARQIKKLAEDDDLRSRMKNESREYAEKHLSKEAILRAFFNELKQVIYPRTG